MAEYINVNSLTFSHSHCWTCTKLLVKCFTSCKAYTYILKVYGSWACYRYMQLYCNVFLWNTMNIPLMIWFLIVYILAWRLMCMVKNHAAWNISWYATQEHSITSIYVFTEQSNLLSFSFVYNFKLISLTICNVVCEINRQLKKPLNLPSYYFC